MTTIATLSGWLVAVAASGGPGMGTHLGNGQRTGYVPVTLRPPYHVAWVWADRHAPRPAWREPVWEPQRIDFDYAHALVADGERAYVVSAATHEVRALDTHTGGLQWRFVADGPVRLAPEVHAGRVYFGADDGCLYCLDASSGQLRWRFRPPVPDERLIGNEQLISRWPARSGVLIEDGRLYTTFGMLAPEGVLVYCLTAATGEVQWVNDASGTRYMARPHVVGMGGVSPQGYLALSGDVLVVTCGRAPPALFDKRTGALRYHEAEGDFTGGAWMMTADNLVFTPCESLAKEYGSQLRRSFADSEAKPFESASLVALDATTGREVFTLQGGRRAVLAADGALTLVGRDELIQVRLDDVRRAAAEERTILHTTGHFVSARQNKVWSVATGVIYTLMQTEDVLWTGGRDEVRAVDGATGKLLWQVAVEGQVRDLAAGTDCLLASTTTGKVYCIRSGAGQGGVPVVPRVGQAHRDWPAVATRSEPGNKAGCATVTQVAAVPPLSHGVPELLSRPQPSSVPVTGDESRWAQAVLAASGVRDGYCLTLGDVTAGELVELARDSNLNVTCVADPHQVDALRATLDEAALYGVRVTVQSSGLAPLPYADYFADLVLYRVETRDQLDRLAAGEWFRVVRPCGGVGIVSCPDSLVGEVARWLAAGDLSGQQTRRIPGGVLVQRAALAGAGQWTHQYADPGKSCASDETRVRLPLKALWFGGLGPDKIVSRHFRAPAPLVLDGRCFVPGTDHLIAMDIYNGRILWQRALPDLAHWPAAYRGPSVAVDHEAVYAVQGTQCLRLDPRTGRTLDTYEGPLAEIPGGVAAREGLIWEYLAVVDDLVIGSLGVPHVKPEWWSKAYPANPLVFAMDKQSKTLRWCYRAEEAVDSNALVAGQGKLFLIDGLPRYGELRRKGPQVSRLTPRTLVCLDLDTGTVVWTTSQVVPTLNSLWLKGDVLLATVTPFSRAMEDPPVARLGGGVTAYAVKDGAQLWRLDDVPTCSPVLTDNVVYLPQAYNLRSGQPVQVANQITGRPEHFVPDFPRTCANFAGCANLLMARSGSLGFYDLNEQSGYFHYSIVRAGCWINMIPAGGLVVVPEGSSSCVCAYNYKMSLALISDDRASHFGIARTRQGKEVHHLCLNFGAPGDRLGPDGRLWYAFPRPVAYGRPLAKARYGPKIGGGRLPMEASGMSEAATTYQRNPDWFFEQPGETPWLYASGLSGPWDLTIRLAAAGGEDAEYIVTLEFCAPDEPPTQRVFDVQLQERTVLAQFDLAAATNGGGRTIRKSFPVRAREMLTLALVPRAGGPPVLSGLSIERQP